ncbi:MAG: hypothetical protein N4A41_03250 [Crocinitomicaceae bacterium]|nr:hypothetical protein [Crocinitomicaceae bacterium]
MESTYSWTWVFLLLSSFFLTLPLFRKRLIGILGLLLFVGVCIKPILIPKTPKEDAISFLKTREKAMIQMIRKHQDSGDIRVIDEEIKNLGFEQLIVEGDIFIFIIHSLIDNSYGFCYRKDHDLPKNILDASTHFEMIDEHWYLFSTT